VVGARNADSSPPSRTEPSGIIHQVVPFETQMDQALAAADLVVARAGASTVAELAAMAMPSILVPWPGAAADHQRANARWLLAAGGAVVIEDSEWDAARMALELDALMADPDRLEALSVGAESVGTTDGADRVAELIERYAR
jgi:UDP-N-acetylglucosamine--N-acetylmuramyl-(pentapeptide) pyrophosphoryl-undecaprenol N-acetylglucosamine transferase